MRLFGGGCQKNSTVKTVKMKPVIADTKEMERVFGSHNSLDLENYKRNVTYSHIPVDFEVTEVKAQPLRGWRRNGHTQCLFAQCFC